jgi:hypothetical protein
MAPGSFSRPDTALQALRPLVPIESASNDAELATVGYFLHTTLRPVLKLQNDLLLAVVTDFVLDHHIALSTASPTDQQRLLTELLARNTRLRYTIVGLVSGQFTTAEYAFYRQHRSELNRRILELAQQRVLDQTAVIATACTA